MRHICACPEISTVLDTNITNFFNVTNNNHDYTIDDFGIIRFIFFISIIICLFISICVRCMPK